MLCPICHSDDLRTVNTIQKSWGVRRQRKCGRCGHSWGTAEMPEAELEHMRKIVLAARGLADLLPEEA
jgi:transcriptional regulator NrdR family protein